MVLVAWLVFRTPPAPVDEAQARDRLAFDEPDFKPGRWLLDEDGKAALAEGEGGDFALVARLGADLVTRRFRPGGAKAKVESGALFIKPAGAGGPVVRIAAPDAAAWVRKLSVE
jgi:hypothetical protein